MKLLFIEAEKHLDLTVKEIDFSILPKFFFLSYSIQFKDLAEKIRENLGKRVKGFSQVLGCSMLKTRYPIFLIGSGRFHAVNLALRGNIVYILDGPKITKIDEKEVERINAKRKAALARYYAAKRIGLLVSAKPGQENLKKAIELKESLEKKGKKLNIFLSDNINLDELENFFVDSWVNTSCPALTFDSRVVSLHELED